MAGLPYWECLGDGGNKLWSQEKTEWHAAALLEADPFQAWMFHPEMIIWYGGIVWYFHVFTVNLLLCSTATADSWTWGRGWMTKASGVGERRKGRGELRRDCHHRVAALFVPTRMQQWYMIYNNDKYGGGGRGGAFRVKNHVMSLGSPGILAKARRL